MRLCNKITLAVATLVFAAAAHAARPCDEFYARLPNVSWALCDAARLQASTGKSVKGRMIYTRDIEPDQVRLRVLVIGGMHGDELSSASVALHWIRLAQAAPAQTYWRFIPALNPDGLFDRPARRVNANGVDLNRNMPTPNWEHDAAIYWEQRTRRDPRRWPGKQPLSEPETRFLHEEIQRFKPNLIVSIHAPYGVLDFDGPIEPPRRLGRLHLEQVGIFPGSLGNYGGVQKGMPVVTIELHSALLTPRNVEIERMWRDLGNWMGETMARNEPATPVEPLAGQLAQ
jgi:murein peptide amidase A